MRIKHDSRYRTGRHAMLTAHRLGLLGLRGQLQILSSCVPTQGSNVVGDQGDLGDQRHGPRLGGQAIAGGST